MPAEQQRLKNCWPKICESIEKVQQPFRRRHLNRILAETFTKVNRPVLQQGETSGIMLSRMDKDDITCELFGNIDELSATLGMVRAENVSCQFKTIILRIQQELIAFCADIASGSESVSSEHIRQMESDTEQIESELPAVTQFILPGENRLSAMLHFSRTVCRRAERTLTTYCRMRKDVPCHSAYLNRLSSLLFAMARKAEIEQPRVSAFALE